MEVVNPLDPFLRTRGFVLLDGALATELERRGFDIDDPLWSAKLLIDRPECIEAVHYDYFAAGADVGTSASYQATFEGFRARGIGEAESERLLRLSVSLVERARERFQKEGGSGRRRPLVAASLGCYGAFLHDGSEYRGDYGLSLGELVDFHRRRLLVLADSGADLLAFETIPSRLEAEAILELLREHEGLPPAWVSFSCRNGIEVSHGELFSECVRLASAAESVVAVGVNCTAPKYVSSLLEAARDATDKPLVVYPNSGESWDAAKHAWVGGGDSPPIEELARNWRRLGARLLGGCCRTTPETIRSLSGALTSSEKIVADDAPQGS